MQIFVSVILIASAVFNVVAWPTFFRRVAADPRARDASGRRTPFLTVHLVLLLLALAIALASAVAAVLVIAGV